jgi:hypothetical protein
MSPVAEWGLIVAGGRKREGSFLVASVNVSLSDLATATTDPIPLLRAPAFRGCGGGGQGDAFGNVAARRETFRRLSINPADPSGNAVADRHDPPIAPVLSQALSAGLSYASNIPWPPGMITISKSGLGSKIVQTGTITSPLEEVTVPPVVPAISRPGISSSARNIRRCAATT